MYNLLIAVGLSALMYVLVGVGFYSSIAGVLPALIVFGVSYFFLARRTGRLVQAEMERLAPMLQQQKTDEAKELLESLVQRFGKWQFLLGGQLLAQVGMIDYLRLEYDSALPNLEKGKWRNWTALMCIALIHHRRGDAAAAEDHFVKARKAAPKEAMVYLVPAVVSARGGDRDAALTVLAEGLKVQDSQLLKDVQNKIQNKKRVDVSKLPQTWYQFFPEDLRAQYMRQMRMQGPRPGQGFPQPRVGKRARRGR